MSIGLHSDPNGSSVARLAGSFLEETKYTQEKLSSGKRIIRSFDDAGAYSVSEKMAVTIDHKMASYHNLQNGLSFLQTQACPFPGDCPKASVGLRLFGSQHH